MRKKILFAIIYFSTMGSLSAKEPIVAMLDVTISNEIQRFGIANYTFECKPYGILTLETLYYKAEKSSRCQKSIEKFYINHPTYSYYVETLLENKQRYHIEIKNRECIVYAKGQVTLSEILIREGLAVTQEHFKDQEFIDYFTLAQRKAKVEKKGLWSTDIFTICTEKSVK